MQEASIFTKIIDGEVPCHKIYEDELTFAFLDIYPSSLGHTLVVPKKQVESLWDLDQTDYMAVMDVCRKIALSHRQRIGVKYVGLKVIGTDVPHAHVHIVPFNDVKAEYYRISRTDVEPDHNALAEEKKKLRVN